MCFMFEIQQRWSEITENKSKGQIFDMVFLTSSSYEAFFLREERAFSTMDTTVTRQAKIYTGN